MKQKQDTIRVLKKDCGTEAGMATHLLERFHSALLNFLLQFLGETRVVNAHLGRLVVEILDLGVDL
jgi:hypothetical protein